MGAGRSRLSLEVSAELLRHMFLLPDGIEIIGAEYAAGRDVIRFTVTAADAPSGAQYVEPLYSSTRVQLDSIEYR